MADDADVPPLEDMTEVVRKADAIRESRNGPAKSNGVSNVGAKERAKVVKKPAARVVKPSSELGKGDASPDQPDETQKPAPASVEKSSNTGMFGGMKKGFLFGSSGGSNKTSSSKPTSAKLSASKSSTENIPYISPKGQTKSELTFDEVQQAMSEAKGLMENQDWITNDLLTKIEKNETLRKKFADPTFMQALEEFQKDPEGAMLKYKGNQEVEKFLQEFCGLLGDHFSSLGDSSGQQKPQTGVSGNQGQSPKPSPSTKAAGISKDLKSEAKSTNAMKKPPKIVELTPDQTSTPESSKSKPNQSSKPKIVELDDEGSSSASALSKLNIDTASSQSTGSGSGKGRVPDIMTYTPGAGADIQEVPKGPFMEDEEVREVLKDQKVMETLMDPQVMNIIQLLRTDPEKAQKIVDKATGDLKERITLLIMKGLLRFQAS